MKKIISFNVNGIRAAINKGFESWLKNENPDIICIQETKAQKEQVEYKIFNDLGYFDFWNSAEKKGYSGLLTLTKSEPDNIELGVGIGKFDKEGRLLRTDFGDITLINTYFPSGTMGDIRQDFKMEWLKYFLIYINNLKKSRTKIIVSGDFNICHKAIDIHHPERHINVSGFLPEEREWVDSYVNSGFKDSFRIFNSEPGNYTWWSYRAGSKTKNLGWRIDYHMVSNPLKNQVKNVNILKNINFSDHCPISIEIDF